MMTFRAWEDAESPRKTPRTRLIPPAGLGATTSPENKDVISSDSARDKLTVIPHCILPAFWYFNIFKKINEDAKSDDFNKITALINGGYIHYNERLSLFNKLVLALNAEHLNQKQIDSIFFI